MPSPNPTSRREFKGAAAATTLQNSMTSSDTTFVLVSANNWPTGGVGKFIVTINRGQADEEKILCDTQASRNVACLLANRGFDGTTAQSHAAGATVEHTISAYDADEWNAHTNATTNIHGFTGDLSALSAAWTAYTPVLSAITTAPVLGNGSISGSYLRVGKTVNFNINVTFGSTTTYGSGSYSFSLPVAPLSNAVNGSAFIFTGSNGEAFVVQGTGGSATIFLYDGSTALGSGNSHLVAGATLGIAGTYQTA